MENLRRVFVAAFLSCTFGLLLAFITHVTEYPLLFVSLASSIIMVFTSPNNRMSKPKTVVGSHLVAAASGVASASLLGGSAIGSAGLSLFILVVFMMWLDILHPPAGGTAWSFALYPQTPEAFIGLIGGTLLLSLITFGGKDSITMHFLLYFYGTPFKEDSAVKTVDDIEKVLEQEYEILQAHPFLGKKYRILRLERNEKARKLMYLVLKDQTKDRQSEEKLINEIKKLDAQLESHESKQLERLDKKLDESMDKLTYFIKEFGEG